MSEESKTIEFTKVKSKSMNNSKKIRVIHFADIINRYDFIDNVIRYLDREKFEVGSCLRSFESNIQPAWYDESVPVWLIPGKAKRGIARAAFHLARVLRHWRADILHTHHYDQALIGWLATKLYPQTKLIIGRHYSDAIYRLPSKIKSRIFLTAENVVNKSAACIIVPSKYIHEILINQQGISADKIEVIYYGFDPEKYSLPSEEEVIRIRAELNLNGKFAIGTFARLHEEKGHRFLLEAIPKVCEEVQNLVWLIVGDGPERQELERRVEKENLGKWVKFLGWRRDAIKLMAAVDAVVQPTLHEAFSQVMAEAMWMKKPLVITEVSGAVDIIMNRENGIVVPKADSSALAQAIEELIENPELRAKLSENGRKYVEQNLIVQKLIPKYESAYLRVYNKI